MQLNIRKKMKQLTQVKQFHKAFKVPAPSSQETLTVARSLLRYKLIREELEELHEALINKDNTEALDAIIDIMYVTLGTAVELGISSEVIEKAFNEVHKSNMSKLDEYGKPIFREDGKVLKSKLYFKPDLSQFIE